MTSIEKQVKGRIPQSMETIWLQVTSSDKHKLILRRNWAIPLPNYFPQLICSSLFLVYILLIALITFDLFFYL